MINQYHSPLRSEVTQLVWKHLLGQDSENIAQYMEVDSGQKTSNEQAIALVNINNLRNHSKQKLALDNSKGIRMKGSVSYMQSGLTGKITTTFLGNRFYKHDMNFGKFGSYRIAVQPNGVTEESDLGSSLKEKYGKYIVQAQKDHPAAYVSWYDFYDMVEFVGSDSLNGRSVSIVELSGGNNPTATLYIDNQNGHILKRQQIYEEGTLSLWVATTFEDYRDINGVMLPFKVTTSNQILGTRIVQYDSVEINKKFEANHFFL